MTRGSGHQNCFSPRYPPFKCKEGKIVSTISTDFDSFFCSNISSIQVLSSPHWQLVRPKYLASYFIFLNDTFRCQFVMMRYLRKYPLHRNENTEWPQEFNYSISLAPILFFINWLWATAYIVHFKVCKIIKLMCDVKRLNTALKNVRTSLEPYSNVYEQHQKSPITSGKPNFSLYQTQSRLWWNERGKS